MEEKSLNIEMACIHNWFQIKCYMGLQQNGTKANHIKKLLRKNYEK